MKTGSFHLLFILLFCSFFTHAQYKFSSPAPTSGMASSDIAGGDPWISMINPAASVQQNTLVAGCFYNNDFILPSMGTGGSLFLMPFSFGTFTTTLRSSGYEQFRETLAGLSYGMALSDRFTGGIGITYHRIAIGSGYGSSFTLTGKIGMRVQLHEQFTLGFLVNNPTRSRIAGLENARSPTRFRVGGEHHLSPKVRWTFALSKDLEKPLNFKLGTEYHITDPLFIRAGCSATPVEPAFGFGVKMKRYRVDLAASFHPILGFSPRISLLYTHPS